MSPFANDTGLGGDDGTEYWVDAARRGDDGSFAELYRRVAPAISAWAELRIPPTLRSGLGPEDIVQEVWVRALSRFDSYDASRGVFRQWVFGFAHNVLLNALKAQRHRRSAGSERTEGFDLQAFAAEVTTISRRIARDENLQAFVSCVREMPAEDRDLLALRGLEGLSHQEVAEELGISAAAARKRWERVRRSLDEIAAPAGILADD